MTRVRDLLKRDLLPHVSIPITKVGAEIGLLFQIPCFRMILALEGAGWTCTSLDKLRYQRIVDGMLARVDVERVTHWWTSLKEVEE